MEKQNYIAPQVEMLEIEIEKGFAQSFVPQDGQNGNEYWL